MDGATCRSRGLKGDYMLILKGSNGKSKVVDIILNGTDSICFVYNDSTLFLEGSICLDSRVYTLEHLKLCIVQEITKYQDYYDYLVVYTNQTENDLKDFIYWLKMTFTYKSIIVACK